MRLCLGLTLSSMSQITPAFSPASLAFSGLWLPSFSGAPWAATASAGVSGTTGALAASPTSPDTGSAVNGYTPASFAAAKALTNSANANVLFTGAEGTIIALFYANSAAAPTGNKYDDAALLHDSSVRMTLNFSSSGVGITCLDGISYKQAITACSTGAWHLAMGRWSGSNTVGITLDSASEVTTALGASVLTDGTDIYAGYYQPLNTIFDGSALMLATAAYAVTDLEYADLKSWVNTTFALSL